MKPILNISLNVLKIFVIITLTLFGASLVLTYYDGSIGNYLISITLFLTSISFIATIKHRSKNENAKPLFRRNFTGIACLIALFLLGISLALTIFNTTVLFYLIDIVLFGISTILFVKVITQVKKNRLPMPK
jgi:membrane protease YdiL (CAAX protease family)